MHAYLLAIESAWNIRLECTSIASSYMLDFASYLFDLVPTVFFSSSFAVQFGISCGFACLLVRCRINDGLVG